MSSLNVPGRSNSIKRTPSDLSRELAERELPEPEFLRSHENRDAQDRKLEEVGGRLAKMDGDEPEALVMTHRRRQSEKAQEAMAQTLSSLELGMPERIARANARADGASTPIPPVQSEGTVSVPTTPAVELDEPPAVATASGSAAQAGAEQVVTPWDVQGAVVEGVQVRQQS
ncbi:proline-rich-protein [Rhodotorula diobovata]|uniref:Proline-rich-protein n=1 Tax=Rhodotorula diobovata TaxID=5288 RepID=A0A5C5FW50_9BASI|nr:proline-rich-protein [Rhodotorula diobovata]